MCYLEERAAEPSGLVAPKQLCAALGIEEACAVLPGFSEVLMAVREPPLGTCVVTFFRDQDLRVVPLLRYELAEAIKVTLEDVEVFRECYELALGKCRIILYHDLCRDPQRLALPPREVRNDILYFGPNPNPNWVGGSRP